MSFYKETIPTPAPSAIGIETIETTTPVEINHDVSGCTTCLGWQLLIVETVVLLLYFYYAKKSTSVKPVYSILIPVLTSMLFWNTNNGCVSKAFTCKYFIPLNIIIFMIIVVTHKNKHLNFKTRTYGKLDENNIDKEVKKKK